MIGTTGFMPLRGWPMMLDPPTWQLAEWARYEVTPDPRDGLVATRYPDAYRIAREMFYVSVIMVLEVVGR